MKMQIILFAVVIIIFLATAIITLLGVAGRLNVKDQYLRVLVAALLVESGVAVYAQFRAINLEDPETLQPFLTSLQAPFTPSTTEQQARNAINEAFVDAGLVPGLQTSLTDCTTDLSTLAPYKNHFLVRLARLQTDLTQYGSSVNLRYPDAPAKHAIAELLLELLAELGHYKGNALPDPQIAHDVLESYQQSKGFSTTGYLSRPTINAMINDYLLQATAI